MHCCFAPYLETLNQISLTSCDILEPAVDQVADTGQIRNSLTPGIRCAGQNWNRVPTNTSRMWSRQTTVSFLGSELARPLLPNSKRQRLTAQFLKNPKAHNIPQSPLFLVRLIQSTHQHLISIIEFNFILPSAPGSSKMVAHFSHLPLKIMYVFLTPAIGGSSSSSYASIRGDCLTTASDTD